MVGCLLALVTASADPVTLSDAGIAPIAGAIWVDPRGGLHEGITGSGVVILTEEGFDASIADVMHCPLPGHHTTWVGVGSLPITSIESPVSSSGPGHGTMVVGALCGSGAQSDGEITGAAPGVHVMSSFATCGRSCATGDWYKVPNLRIVQASSDVEFVTAHVDMGLPAESDLLVIYSAGNSGGDGSDPSTLDIDTLHFPSIMVAAGQPEKKDVASYSSRGDIDDKATWPTLTAPGCMFVPTPPQWIDAAAVAIEGAILRQAVEQADCYGVSTPEFATRILQGYVQAAGTSFASPTVAGIAALMFEVNPSLTAQQAWDILTQTADPFLTTEDTDRDGRISSTEFYEQHGWKAGYGFVNATAAVAASHYMEMRNATVGEATMCFTTLGEDGAVRLNEPGSEIGCAARGDPVGATGTVAGAGAEVGTFQLEDSSKPGQEAPIAPLGLIIMVLAVMVFVRAKANP